MKGRYFGYTCPNCYHRPLKSVGSDWVGPTRMSIAPTVVVNLGWPKRCRPCDTNYRRAKRTSKALRKLASLSFHTHKQWPKLLTVGLPCKPGEDKDQLMADLKKKWLQLRKLLVQHGVSGGKYVYEMTSRLTPLDEGQPLMTWKHHPHVHAVVICPYVQKRDLPDFCKIPLQLGLGRINLRAVKELQHVARYISKYITKQSGFRSAQWGTMIGYIPPSFQKEV